MDRRDARTQLEVGAGAVRHRSPAGLKEFTLLLVHLHAVGQGGPRAEETQVGEEGDVLLAVFFEDGLRLPGMLGGVGVDPKPLRLGPATDLAEQVLRAGEDEARVVGEEEPVVLPMEALDQTLRLVQAVPAVPGEAGREAPDAFVVHQGVAEDGAHRMPGQLFEDRAGVPDRLHALEGRAAALLELRDREAGGLAEGVGRVRGLEGPDLLAQPGEEGQVLGESAEECLAEVDVRLDETGEGVEALQVPNLFAGAGPELPDLEDFAILDPDGSFQDFGLNRLGALGPGAFGQRALTHGHQAQTLEAEAAHFF